MSATITLPLDQQSFTQNLSEDMQKIELEWKEYNWMGRIVYWIRTTSSKGIIQKTFVHTIAVLVTLILMVSVIGVPLLLYACSETVRQQERSLFARKMQHLTNTSTENNRMHFLLGRLGLFDGAYVKLNSSTRNYLIQMIRRLGVNDEKSDVPLENLSDAVLLENALAVDKNNTILAQCKLKIYA